MTRGKSTHSIPREWQPCAPALPPAFPPWAIMRAAKCWVLPKCQTVLSTIVYTFIVTLCNPHNHSAKERLMYFISQCLLNAFYVPETMLYVLAVSQRAYRWWRNSSRLLRETEALRNRVSFDQMAPIDLSQLMTSPQTAPHTHTQSNTHLRWQMVKVEMFTRKPSQEDT